MLRKFFFWLEQGAYSAICRGCQKAVQDLTSGQVMLDVEPALLADESESADASLTARRTAPKKQATRK